MTPKFPLMFVTKTWFAVRIDTVEFGTREEANSAFSSWYRTPAEPFNAIRVQQICIKLYLQQ